MTKEELIAFEKRIETSFNNGELPYLIHLSGGNEDQLIKIFNNIKPGDWIFSTHRSHYHYLLAGGPPEKLEKMIMDGRSMFVFDKDLNFYSSSIVCATPSIAAGVAWALKKQGSDKKVWCFLGDGAEDEGHLYEAARYVDGWNLPCTFIVEDNDRSVSAGKKERWGTEEISNVFKCVERYRYISTWPHGGTGTNGWLEFKRDPIIEQMNYIRRFPKKDHIIFDPPEKYIDAVKQSMNMLARNINAVFIGYNVRHGSAYGTLKDIPEDQRLETPLAENLMTGLAMGMSLIGFRPVLYFERHDFIYNALDALINQLDKIDFLSQRQFTMPVIIKVVSGSIKPFYAGLTHTSNLNTLFRDIFHFPVYFPVTPRQVIATYDMAAKSQGPVLVSERKELY